MKEISKQRVKKRKAEKIIREAIPSVLPHEPFCINCHFLCQIGEVIPEISEVDWNRRELCGMDNYEWLNAHYLACFFGKWNENQNPELQESRKEVLFKKNRRWKCYFWKYKSDVGFEHGKILRDSERDIFYKNHTLMIAAIALFFSIFNLIKSC